MMKPIILGAGLAGLSVALELAPMPVIVVSPCALGTGCSSAWAQGGVAAAVGTDDSARLHATDTVAAGAGLNDATIVRQVTQDGSAVIAKLATFGVAFDRDESGTLRLGLEAAHQKRRIVHARDATGHAIMETLIAAVRTTPSITVIENAIAENLIVEDGRIVGVAIRRGDETTILQSDHVVLATGGASALWRDTTNPHENWGSGLALAARAGVTLGDLEFAQFHPTAIDIGRDPMPLASEALRGEGAVLIDESGARFTDELQPRDIVTRAIWGKISAGQRVFLDARHLDSFAARFPNIYAICMSAGIDPATMPIPVRPAAHYHMGGVVTDAQGRTDIAGLWACGEIACTGLHGANRLASNSLLEAASFGVRVARDIKDISIPVMCNNANDPSPPVFGGRGAFPDYRQTQNVKWGEVGDNHHSDVSPTSPLSLFGTVDISCPPSPPEDGRRGSHRRSRLWQKDKATIRAIMSEHVGVIRDRVGLEKAVAAFLPLVAKSDIALTAAMIAISALRREESRGAHFRSDFPHMATEAKRSFFHISQLEDFR